MSFFYFRQQLRGKKSKAITLLNRMRRAKAKGYGFMLDSGAFTYKVRQGTGQMPPADKYFDSYYNFVLDHGDVFDAIIEFDVDGVAKNADGSLITVPQVDEWTNRFLNVHEIASKTMPVYQASRGSKWLRDWLIDVRSPLIALASNADTQNEAAQIISTTHRFGKFIHGLAQTRIKTDLKYTNYDSIDSTTWLRADKFGGTCIFKQGRFIVLDHLHKKDRALYRDWYESWGLDFKKIAQDDLDENRLATIIAWREMATHFETQWAVRGGKYPYLYTAHQQGSVPAQHPVLTRFLQKKQEEQND